MRKHRVVRSVAIIALLVPSGAAMAMAPAYASGCSGAYVNGNRAYQAYGCTGFPSNYHMRARATCVASGVNYVVYGPWTIIAGSSTTSPSCSTGEHASSGTAEIQNS